MYTYAGLPFSLILIAFGGILAFGVNDTSVTGVDINAIGVILMIVGMLGLALTFLFWSSIFGTNDRGATAGHTHREAPTVYRDAPVIVEREEPVRYREVERTVTYDAPPTETERVVVRDTRGSSYR